MSVNETLPGTPADGTARTRPWRRGAAVVVAGALALTSLLVPGAAANATVPPGSQIELEIQKADGTDVAPGAENVYAGDYDDLYTIFGVGVDQNVATWPNLPTGASGVLPVILPAGSDLPDVAADGSTFTDDPVFLYQSGTSPYGGSQGLQVLGGMFTSPWFEGGGVTGTTYPTFQNFATTGLQEGTVYRLALVAVGDKVNSEYAPNVLADATVDASTGKAKPWAAWFSFTVSATGWTLVAPTTPQVAFEDPVYAAGYTSGSWTVDVTNPAGGAALTDLKGKVQLYRFDGSSASSGVAVGDAVPVGADGKATFPLSGLTPGSSGWYYAQYLHDDATELQTYTDSDPLSATWQLTVPNPVTTSTALSIGGGSLTAGETQTLTATVTPAGAAGSVQFFDGSSSLGSATVSTGTASVPVKLAAGSHGLKAVFTPAKAAEYVGSESEVKTVTVTAAQAPAAQPATTATRLSVSGTKTAGKSQTVTATVSPAAAGTVTFRDGGAVLGAAAVSNGSASVSVTLAAGTHALTASFTPADASAFAASSASGSVSIAKAKASVSVKAAKSVKKGKALKVTVTVKASGLTPTGKVTVAVAGKKATGTLKKGKATVSVKKIAKTGKQKIAVSYAGSSQIAKASSAKATVSVKK